MGNKGNHDKLRENVELINCEKYNIIKDNTEYQIEIENYKNKIIIKCKNYQIILDNKNKNYKKLKVKTIDKAYQLIKNIFTENKVFIKNIITNKKMVLLLPIHDLSIKKDIELILLYKKENNKDINTKEFNNKEIKIKEINNKEINNKEINDNLNNDVKEEEKNIIENNNESSSNNFEYYEKFKKITLLKEITIDSYADYGWLDNSFIVFKSIYGILHLIYSTEKKSIVSFNLIDNVKIIEIKNAHEEHITNFKYYFDKNKERDLILSISTKGNNIKLWNNHNFECLFNFDVKYTVLTACFLIDNNNIYIIVGSNYNNSNSVIDINGKKISEFTITESSESFMDTYYDNKLSKTYIIVGRDEMSLSYDYNNKVIYHKYYYSSSNDRSSIIISDKENIVKLIESGWDGSVRIWNFHSGDLLKKIGVSNGFLFGICLWDNEILVVGCGDKKIRLIELNNGTIIKELIGHNQDYIMTIKKIILPEYGECFLSQGWKNDQIKLWILGNKN